MRILAFLFGVILLFPGACAFGFMVLGAGTLPAPGSAQWRDSNLWGMIAMALVGWGFCFLISFGGVILIRDALAPKRPNWIEDDAPPPDPRS